MKILVIPDLHEDLNFLRYIIAMEDPSKYDKVVMLGDYFDPHQVANPDEKNLRQVVGTILGFKEILGDKLHLLCGNHDLPYYALRPACGENTGLPNRIISNWLGNTTCARAEIINEIWDEAFWHELECAVYLGGWLFSHAGVHSSWWREDLSDTEARVNWLNQRWQHGFERIYEEAEPEIFAAGRARGGLLDYGSPIWLDFDEEFEDTLEVPQIVGHTSCAKQTQKGRSFCIDMRQAAYGVVDGDDMELRILPHSWLAMPCWKV